MHTTAKLAIFVIFLPKKYLYLHISTVTISDTQNVTENTVNYVPHTYTQPPLHDGCIKH